MLEYHKGVGIFAEKRLVRQIKTTSGHAAL